MELNESQMLHRIQWVRDLISGEFKQGRHSLKVFIPDVSYCCLGVALERIDPNSEYMQRSVGGCYSIGIGLNDEHESILGLSADEHAPLMNWNDGNQSFEFIADRIAYATDRGIYIDRENLAGVPLGFAKTWLEKLDELATSAS